MQKHLSYIEWFDKLTINNRMDLFKKRRVFLDFASATPVLREVRREMRKYWSKDFYNPSSIYDKGVGAKKALEEYRARFARALGAGRKNVFFTSGATESDNLAILGAYAEYKEKFPKKAGHLVVSVIEHPAVLEVAKELERRGVKVSRVSVDESGLVNPLEVSKLLKTDTFLVSIGLVNGEIGTIQPIAKIGRTIRERRKEKNSQFPYLHTDASQALGFLPINIENLHVDLVTLESAKAYGPKGVGLLAVRAGVHFRPITWGGGQESRLRPGTENLALIAGFSKAFEIAEKNRDKEFARLASLREFFVSELQEKLPQVVINGPLKDVLPSIVSVSMSDFSPELELLALDREGVMVSIGSACSSNSEDRGSYVIRALGKKEFAESTLRFSFGRSTTKRDLERAVSVLYRRASHW
ncbi:MAG: cysteine desulfurase family protein [Parcubacteria group bacterium]